MNYPVNSILLHFLFFLNLTEMNTERSVLER